MSRDNNDKWKDKYLRQLDELEQKEKLWAEAEDLLRRSVGRMAHTGYGLDRALDRQLDRVRNAVKAKQEATALDRLVREASETAIQIQEQSQAEQDATAQSMAQLLKTADLDGARKKQARQLAKKLESQAKDQRLAPLLQQAATLLAGTDSTTEEAPAAPQPTPRRGLLSRLMGSNDHARAASDQPEPAPPRDSERPLSAHTLDTFLGEVEAGANWADRIDELRRKAAVCRQENEAADLLREAASVMSEILQAADAAEPASRTVVETLPNAGEALLELMSKLEIPHHLQERLGAIKAALVRASTDKQIRLVVQAIADLMEDIRREVQNEKKELESFLESVTNRIQLLSESVVGLGDNRAAARESRQEFQDSFRDHMDGIRSRMEATDDVETLKLAIQDGLDAIETQLSRYVRREEELTREAEERIADLSSRLHDMKHEAFMLQQKMQEQRDLAMTDPLTGVFNRLAFDEHVENEFNRWKRYGDPLSLCVLDIDHFKRINDTFGHLAGDKALKAMAVRLQQNVREVDIVARYGGEEFVVIMPKTPADQAYLVAEKLRSVIAGAGFHYREQPVNITVSCGVATFHEGDDPSSVFKRADDALYGAKQAGRNRTHREDEPAESARTE